jgi:hypothetical protein
MKIVMQKPLQNHSWTIKQSHIILSSCTLKKFCKYIDPFLKSNTKFIADFIVKENLMKMINGHKINFEFLFGWL